MAAYTDVLFDVMPGNQGDVGIITLNRPKVLNALNHGMIHAMHEQLKKWELATDIKAVVIRAAEGRAFCAGGDLRLTYDRYKTHDPTMAYFFHDEYQLNRCIFHYPKPYVALIDGITMGGGVGISIHGSHRVATERTIFAMPETGIGFFPDVGGTYFLPRLARKTGYYLGLVGAHISSDDCVSLGIANAKISSHAGDSLIQAIAATSLLFNPRDIITKIIQSMSQPIQGGKIQQHIKNIESLFSYPSIEEIIHAASQMNDDFSKELFASITKKSPTSLKVTLLALQQSEHQSFDACMRQEFRLSCRFLQEHDFAEGIRAVIIDKDQNPQWRPATLEGVTPSIVAKYFAPLEQELV